MVQELRAITLDIDDTTDTVHGHQQLSLFNTHYNERCFLPIHVYDAGTGHCVLTILRPGKTPDGKEASAHLRRLVQRKRHKSQLASGRTSCRSPLANQMRLILHTAAYRLMLKVRSSIPYMQHLASGKFSTIRPRLLKIAVGSRRPQLGSSWSSSQTALTQPGSVG